MFGKRAAPLSEDERQAAAVDLERIRGGGIPLGAEQRLKRVAASTSPVFTSDLSANEYAVAQASGLTPIAQVMGSSVVQHGWQNYGWSSFGGGVREMPSFAMPWNLVAPALVRPSAPGGAVRGRGRGDRHRDECQSSLGDPGNVEYVVFGTAVRETTLARP